jgi:hypothetical protein
MYLSDYAKMIDLKELKSKKDVRYCLSYLGATWKDQRVIRRGKLSCNKFDLIDDESQPLPMLKTGREVLPGLSLVFVNDLILRDATMYAAYEDELYVLSRRIISLTLCVTQREYERMQYNIFYAKTSYTTAKLL